MWFYQRNPIFSPRIQLFDTAKIKSISALGINFFFLQLTIFFILTTDKFIITQLLGPSEVTTYDILYKYFGAILIIHNIVNGPLWSMYTEAYVKNDHVWIENILIKMLKLSLGYIGILIAMILAADFLITIWLNNNIHFSLSNYIYMSVMLLFLVWHSIFAYFTNGIEKTRVQLYTTAFGALINIPLSVLFVHYFAMGLNGVILATIVSLSIFGVFGPLQALKEIKLMKSSLIIKKGSE